MVFRCCFRLNFDLDSLRCPRLISAAVTISLVVSFLPCCAFIASYNTSCIVPNIVVIIFFGGISQCSLRLGYQWSFQVILVICLAGVATNFILAIKTVTLNLSDAYATPIYYWFLSVVK